jgi:hypothetical protein
MIRMSHSKWAALRVRLALLMVVAVLSGAIAGCCGGAHSHKCDFTPLDSHDGGATDAPLACGTQVCQAPQVCCLTKIAPFAQCIDIQDFGVDRCEVPPGNMPNCTTPKDCDPGMVCCFEVTALSLNCQPTQLCPGDGVDSYLVCDSYVDCPSQLRTSCNTIPNVPDGGPEICTPGGPAAPTP